MSILLSELAQGHEKLVCAKRNTTVQQALDIMLPRKFTQLPIIDEDRRLIGVVSEHSIVSTFHEVKKTYDSLAKLAVTHCLDIGMNTLTPQDDVFAAMDRLETAPYVILIDATHVPIGIVTSYDTGQLFSAMGEVLVRARDIEELLREYIRRAFPSDESMKAALLKSFPNDGHKDVDRLTFGDLISIIVNSKNWQLFDEVLGPQHMFRHYMERARDIRNDIAHFRRKVDKPQDIESMMRSLEWLQARKRLPLRLVIEARAVLVANAALAVEGTTVKAVSEPNYEALRGWLASHHREEHGPSEAIVVSFADIEQILGVPLPQAAAEHRSWWSNDEQQPHAKAWLSARWYASDVDLMERRVTFTVLPETDDDIEILGAHNAEEW